MENNNEKSGFRYTYSAREQAEIKRIREKYTPPGETEDKLARLYRLDRGVTQTAQSVSLVLGVMGALILGLGMSLCMTDLGAALGVKSGVAMAIGVLAGVVGGALAALAYPVYQAIVKAKRKQIAPEILRLSDELMR